MMEFEGKESIKQQVQQNSLLMQQVQMMQQAIMSFDAAYPQFGLAVAAGLAQPQAISAQAAQGGGARAKRHDGTPEERAAKADTDSTKTAKARTKAAKQAQVG